MKKLVILFMIFFSFTGDKLYSQRSANWCFGDSAGIDFKTTPPSTFISSVKSRGSCVSISDKAGDVLFYAYTRATVTGNTTLVFNSANTLMQNGNNIVGRGWYQELVIIPDPADTNKYYLFSTGATSIYGLFYSVIDMSQNGGFGAVMQKNVQLLSFPANDGLTAVKHGNGRDWWIIFKHYNNLNNDFCKFLISPSGVSAPSIQNIGALTNINSYRYFFSNDGSKLGSVGYRGLIETYDFDRCSGNLFNYRLIRSDNTTSPIPYLWSGAFSSNKQFLYIATSANDSYLLQLNLLDSFPLNIIDTVADFTFPISTGGGLKLAPDGKIYWSCAYIDSMGNFNYPYPDTTYNIYNTYLSVINNPDSLGTACNFQPYSFYLGGARTYWGLPNNPNYELGPDSGSLCDSLTVGILNLEQGFAHSELKIFYHPEWKTAFINAQGLKGKKYLLNVVDILGHLIYKEEGSLDSQYYTHDLSMQGFADAVYIISFVTEKEALSAKFVRH